MRRAAAEAGARSLPWTVEDLLRWLALTVLGLLMVGVAWYLASGEADASSQVGPVNLAIAGAVCGGVANILWLVRGRRAIGERRRALLGEPRVDGPRMPGRLAAAADVPAARSTAVASYVGGDEQSYFHRPGCPLAAGRGWAPADEQQHRAAGRVPCGVCRP